MYIEAKTNRLRKDLRAYLDHVMATGDRVLITRHGKEVAALVTARDFEALEKAQNNREALMEMRHEAKMREFRALKEGLDGDEYDL